MAKYEFEQDFVEILAIGDIHLGSEMSSFDQVLKVIEEERDSKLIFMGDLIDNAIINSLGDIYSQKQNPHEAIVKIRKLFKKYKNRILGVVGGNHERRTWRRVGIDPLSLICTEVNIPYSDDVLIIDIAIKGKRGRGMKNRTHYSIACHHGASGGRFPERSSRQQRYFHSFISGVDIYITGHTHVPDILKLAIHEYDSRNKVISKKETYHITIPAWSDEKYARQKMLQPTANGLIKIKLFNGYKKNIKVVMR